MIENVPTAIAIDMEATLSPIRKYYRSVRGSNTNLHQDLLVMAPIQEEYASTESVVREDLVPPLKFLAWNCRGLTRTSAIRSLRVFS
jgi:hypothetical protein